MEINDDSYDSANLDLSDEKNNGSKIKKKNQTNLSTNTTQINSENEKTDLDFNDSKIVKQKIDAKNNRFPYCIVWTPLPCISWFLPFIGHTGICG